MKNYFKMNNYCNFYSKAVIVMTAIMSNNRECRVVLYFTSEVFRRLANQIHGQICVMLEFLFYSMENYLYPQTKVGDT